MDKKNIVVLILSVVLVIAVFALISVSAKVNKITAEKGEFMKKIRETEKLTADLNKNINDLKAMLGKAETEKVKLTKETEDMRKRLEEAVTQKKSDSSQIKP
ncbi:MAG: hypothetical protein JW994_08100 [Candidatus Omnitrophica bacterium]|nr:hypothetical protein [Candidatus Omnitrophota bacterium]